MSSTHLSGLWGGKYWYLNGWEDCVPFSAWLMVEPPRVHGSILEPNSFILDGPEELDADIQGTVDAPFIYFSKLYPNVDQPPVLYDGHLIDDSNKIVGEWRFPHMRTAAGRFEMTRMVATVAATKKATLRVR